MRYDVTLVAEATDAGTGRHLIDVVRGLISRGLRVHVVCSPLRDPTFVGRLRSIHPDLVGVTPLRMVRPIRPLRDLMALLELWRVFARRQESIIHLHSSKAGALGRAAALLARRGNVLYTPHAFSFLDGSRPVWSRLYLLLERLLRRLTHRLVAVSPSEHELAIRAVGFLPDTVSTIPNGIEPPVIASRKKPSSTLILGSVGRLEPQKQPGELLELARLLDGEGLDFELRIAGRGRLARALEREVAERALERRVRFLGELSEVKSMYASMDVFVTTSAFEGLPYGVLDAMSWCIPVAAYDVVGVNDVVAAEETGLLARPGDLPALAGHVLRLARDADLRARLGKAGRQRVLTHFGLAEQISGLESLYRTLLPRPTPTSSAVPAAGSARGWPG